ncbi:MAG TPA: 3-isopropylmalate dehydratase large subunit, partial [Gammaproteobacteria bacterium]|nr:3-isopropylmalate dehydratase large subunit [Gammaproteobacteria bacterium]
MAQTLYDKLMAAHVVREEATTALIYIDRQLIHEVTSPQAFEGLEMAGRKPWRLDANLAVPDHNVPTTERSSGVTGIKDPISKIQIETLDKNCEIFGINEITMNDIRQGIVHVVGPEQGATLPGMSIVCGDSHTSTHGALGALAFGIGTSEVEHVLATGCLWQSKSKNLKIEVSGGLNEFVSAKDVALYIIGQIGTAGGTGYAIEFAGTTIQGLSVEGRMTLCNMAIEAGARVGMIAVDDKTIEYVKGRPMAPTGDEWDKAVEYWHTLHSDEGAHFDQVVRINAKDIKPQVTWGTSPEMVIEVGGIV